MASKVSIPGIFSQINKPWNPKLVANVDDAYDIKVAKLQGSFIWHSHPEADELFYVLHGTLNLEIEDSEDIVLCAGEIFVVPKGVRHKPVAKEGEVEVLLVEKKGTINTGDEEGSELTVEVEDVRSS